MHEYTDSVSLCKKATGVFTIRILTDNNRKKNFAKGLYKPSELVYNHAIDARHVKGAVCLRPGKERHA